MNEFELNEVFLDNVEKFIEKKFSHRHTLSKLIKVVNEQNQFETFNQLVFTAKYTNGLFRSIKLSYSNPQISNLGQIQKDFSENLEKVRTLIREIFSKDISDSKTEIMHNYLELGQVQFENLISLTDDLDQIKKYLNYLKRKS